MEIVFLCVLSGLIFLIMVKIKIAHLTYSFGTGGVENGIVNLVNRMNQDFFFHYIICFTSSGNFQDRIVSENVEVISINKKPGNSLKPLFLLKDIFVKNKIDIVHSRGWGTMFEGIVSAKLARVPVVIYGFHGKTYEDMQSEKRRRIIAQRLLLKMTDGIITLIDDMKSDFCNSLKIPIEKVAIIKNGVDLDKFSNIDQKQRLNFGFRDEDFIISAVGRIDPVKNYGTMIDAFKIVSAKYDNMKMILVGDGEDYNNIKNKIIDMELSEKIFMLGERNDVSEILISTDVFIQPSLYEGLSNTILEAMSVGLPIIASRVGGNQDIIIDDENGFLFDPLDVKELASKIDEVYKGKDLRANMSLVNKRKIKNEFALEKMVKEYERYYCKLLHKKTGYDYCLNAV